MLIAPIGATLVQLGISRSREYLADETGARLSGDPLALAIALEKLHADPPRWCPPRSSRPPRASTSSTPSARRGGLARLFSTHPPAEERIRRLRAMALDTSTTNLTRGAMPRRPQLH